MNDLVQLYRKDMKRTGGIILAILFIDVLYTGISVLFSYQLRDIVRVGWDFLSFTMYADLVGTLTVSTVVIPTALLLIAPALLVFFLFEERLAHTVVQLHSLPASRASVMAAHLLASLTIGLITLAGNGAYSVAMTLPTEQIIPPIMAAIMRNQFNNGASILWLIGTVCLTGAVTCSLRKNQVLAIVLVAPTLATITMLLAESIPDGYLQFGILVVLGMVFAALGMVVYHRYAEL